MQIAAALRWLRRPESTRESRGRQLGSSYGHLDGKLAAIRMHRVDDNSTVQDATWASAATRLSPSRCARRRLWGSPAQQPPAQRLLSGIAEHPLRSCIQLAHATALVDRYDSVRGRRENRIEGWEDSAALDMSVTASRCLWAPPPSGARQLIHASGVSSLDAGLQRLGRAQPEQTSALRRCRHDIGVRCRRTPSVGRLFPWGPYTTMPPRSHVFIEGSGRPCPCWPNHWVPATAMHSRKPTCEAQRAACAA